jgi:hypothetical protein
VPLSKEKIVSVVNTLHKRAEKDGIQYAVIGGALFKLLGVPWIETEDVDVAASDFVNLPLYRPTVQEIKRKWVEGWYDTGHWSETKRTKKGSTRPGWHLVHGVQVDWMPKGTHGGDELFRQAIKHAYLDENGLWLAPIEWAMAIKIYAGREKDKLVFDQLWDEGWIDGNLVLKIVKEFTTGGEIED